MCDHDDQERKPKNPYNKTDCLFIDSKNKCALGCEKCIGCSSYKRATEPEEDEENLTAIRVSVPITREVDYIIKVPDPTDLEAIKKQLETIDASSWEHDPDFYEYLGDAWRDSVEKITMENISKMEETTGVCQVCNNDCPDCAEVRPDLYPERNLENKINLRNSYQKEISETCQFCKKTFQCSHPNTAYSIRAAHENNCLENPKNKRPEDRFKKTTCVNCNNFKLIFGLSNGICLKGHGYTDETAQGLPVPKKGTGYVMYFDPTCTEDFEEIKEIDKEDRFKKPVKEKVCACETDGKSLCGDKQSMNTLFHFKVTCKDCNDILRKRSQPNDAKAIQNIGLGNFLLVTKNAMNIIEEGMTYHPHITLEYAEKIANKKPSLILFNGKPATKEQLIQCIAENKERGYDVLPTCDNVDSTGKCAGHKL